MITKAERTELRSLVRQQVRTLHAEVAQRRAELEIEMREQIADAVSDQVKRCDDVDFLLQQVEDEANRKANDIFREHARDWPDKHDKRVAEVKRVGRAGVNEEKQRLYTMGMAHIREQVARAELTLKRQETDLLTRLAIGALESEEARAFLSQIPTVSQLVPAVRLAELEASLESRP